MEGHASGRRGRQALVVQEGGKEGGARRGGAARCVVEAALKVAAARYAQVASAVVLSTE